ncbi:MULTISPECIES: hypothetical protein [Haemophilus]|uniref:Uncharacterized protein n=1 Tax=Haemophilus aegyptius TaxID=197575 RepID=A0ABY1VUS4_HAEAE|nr:MULTISPECIES: hypothetical protein [Haemophilus]EGF13530.1 hypothetical protein HMPREF9095_1728 [Haemophilus aegyptius ATCC 11116]OBX84565.1 hypothetical protein A9520_08250 [Haemophilus aegyptius]TMQ42964.1 hypothetical protein AO054_06385 [Haemophilus influenzae biotype aegyptius]UAK81883.1 hypothetical protein K8O83_06085 [Haemophilus aegyptius]SQH37739.1 Uncharacterised protein [Haemophilus aegyptius]
MWKIENAEELLNFIQALKTDEKINLEKVELDFLKQVKIKIQGDPHRYNGSINYAICKGICEFQNEIWRAYAEIKTGKPHITLLTQDEKDALEITFTVNEGCTEIIADLKDLFIAMRKLFKEITNGMNGTQKTLTCTALVLGIGGTIIGSKWVDNQKEIELAKIEATENQIKQQNESDALKQAFQTIQTVATESNNPRFKQSIQAVELHTDKAYSEMIRATSDAEQVTISNGNKTEIKLDKPQLNKIVDDLTAQEKATTTPESMDLYIDGVKRQEGKITLFVRTLQSETFTANLDADMLGEEGVNEIIDRIKDINTIKLEGMVKRRAGKIEQASFSSIIHEE